jgi:hypothetical protein
MNRGFGLLLIMSIVAILLSACDVLGTSNAQVPQPTVVYAAQSPTPNATSSPGILCSVQGNSNCGPLMSLIYQVPIGSAYAVFTAPHNNSFTGTGAVYNNAGVEVRAATIPLRTGSAHLDFGGGGTDLVVVDANGYLYIRIIPTGNQAIFIRVRL